MMTRQARLVWLIVILFVQLLYFPINRTVQGGVILSMPWDAHVPFWPAWAIPYLLSLPWWLACFGWVAWKMDGDCYRAFAIGAIAV